MYDFTHALSDAIEGITHSLCTLEFSDHRPLYDWTIGTILKILKFYKYAAAITLLLECLLISVYIISMIVFFYLLAYFNE